MYFYYNSARDWVNSESWNLIPNMKVDITYLD